MYHYSKFEIIILIKVLFPHTLGCKPIGIYELCTLWKSSQRLLSQPCWSWTPVFCSYNNALCLGSVFNVCRFESPKLSNNFLCESASGMLGASCRWQLPFWGIFGLPSVSIALLQIWFNLRPCIDLFHAYLLLKPACIISLQCWQCPLYRAQRPSPLSAPCLSWCFLSTQSPPSAYPASSPLSELTLHRSELSVRLHSDSSVEAALSVQDCTMDDVRPGEGNGSGGALGG